MNLKHADISYILFCTVAKFQLTSSVKSSSSCVDSAPQLTKNI